MVLGPIAAIRTVVTLFWDETTPPTFADWQPRFRSSLATRQSRLFVDWSWQPPRNWEDGGVGTRRFSVQFRIGSTESVLAGRGWTDISTPVDVTAPAVSHEAQPNGFAQIRVVATNGLSRQSMIFQSDIIPTPVVAPDTGIFGRQFGPEFG